LEYIIYHHLRLPSPESLHRDQNVKDFQKKEDGCICRR